MIYGNMQKSIIKLYPNTNNQIDYIIARGYVKSTNANEFIKVLKTNVYEDFSRLDDINIIEDYFDNQALEFLEDKRELLFSIPDEGWIKQVKSNNIDDFNKKYTIMLDENNPKEVIIVNNKEQTTDSLQTKMYKDYTQVRNMIIDFELKDDYTISTVADSEDYRYYYETTNKAVISRFNDDYIAFMLMLLVNVIDDNNEAINNLLNKLATNPCISGSPILLPPDLAEMQLKIKENTKIKFDALKNFTYALKDYYNAKH